jgi:DNA-binding NarL/FixJ family response regulator
MSLFLLADNQAVTAAGLRYFLSTLFADPDVAEAASKGALMHQLEQAGSRDGVTVILDYSLFDFAGVDEWIIFIRRFARTRWILFSSELSEGLIRRLSAEPKVSMLLKENGAEEIGAALRCAVRGERFLCHQVVNLLLTPDASATDKIPLTASEKEILRLVARGMSVKEIANERCSSIHTITTHKKNIFRKIGVNNVYEAMQYARRAGLADEDYSI